MGGDVSRFWHVLGAIVFWTVAWPLGIAWLFVRLARMPRIERLLGWYPAAWRERYGEEFAELLRESIESGRGGLRLSLDVAREGLAARLDEAHISRPAVCLIVCWIPLIPQGLVPMAFLLGGVPARSWFLALYMPEPLQWATAGAMVALGLALMATGLRGSPVPR
jgi:hypothetical protein